MKVKILLSTIVLLLFACESHEKGKQLPKQNIDKKIALTKSHPTGQAGAGLTIDTLNFDTLEFSQVLQAADSSFYTEDDCRCYQSLFYRTKQNEFVFKNCDSIYNYSRYQILAISKNENEYIVRGKVVSSDKEDTISIRKILKSPGIYKIKRTNYPDVETGGFFIMRGDSAKFDHRTINCDEDQG
jgi:hypothetical protein